MDAKTTTADGPEHHDSHLFNDAVEQALLGSILIDNGAIAQVSDFVRPEHFGDPLHQRLYAQLLKMTGEARLADATTLIKHVETWGEPDEVKSIKEHLSHLVTSALPRVRKPREFGKVLLEYHARREYIRIGKDVTDLAHDPEQTADAIARYLEDSIYQLTEKAPNERPAAMIGDAGGEVLALMEAARDRGDGLAGLSMGFPDLDKITGGLQPGNLVILAGRPGMGKTALGVGIARAVANAGRSVAFFSLEMSRVELARRVIGAIADVPPSLIAIGKVDSDQIGRVKQAEATLKGLPLLIDESGALTIPQLHARARQHRRKGKLDLIVLDYLGLMRGTQSHGSSTNRVQEVTEITNGLKAIAKELDVPVLALSQLNRSVEQREDKRPLLSDLRDSGSIEQDADVVLFCYREEYYVNQRKPQITDVEKYADWNADIEKCAGLAEVTVAKNRHGPSDRRVDLRFDGPTMTFHSLAK